ncbi:hypothetical protein CRENBAI_005116 [Crenichthys baileyi]|uniref:Uncharacterized protein n=1 Tax=Crenichthys baileyi TaxID=28760 RepID=A0AAV9RV10_9TELE
MDRRLLPEPSLTAAAARTESTGQSVTELSAGLLYGVVRCFILSTRMRQADAAAQLFPISAIT